MSSLPISAAPWTAERISRTHVQISSAPDADGFRQVVALVDGLHIDANAALICAAPRMAVALVALLPFAEGGDAPVDAVDEARAALAAAQVVA